MTAARLLGLLLLAGCSTVADADAVLGALDRLAAARPWSPDAVSAEIGLAFDATPADVSTRYFAVYHSVGDADGRFAAAELRQPTGHADLEHGLLLLTPAAAGCVTEADVSARYGEPELEPPSPRQPADAPVYWRYRRDWGVLSFGFARNIEAGACATSIVLDATGKYGGLSR